jgi:hypothetical protein
MIGWIFIFSARIRIEAGTRTCWLGPTARGEMAENARYCIVYVHTQEVHYNRLRVGFGDLHTAMASVIILSTTYWLLSSLSLFSVQGIIFL